MCFGTTMTRQKKNQAKSHVRTATGIMKTKDPIMSMNFFQR